MNRVELFLAMCRAIPRLAARAKFFALAPIVVAIFSQGFGFEAAADERPLGIPAIAPTPRNFPRHSAEDVKTMFETAADCAEAAVFIYQWSNPELSALPAQMNAIARQHRLTPVIGLSPTTLGQERKELDAPAALRGKRSFSDMDVRAAYVKSAENLAQFKPPYLCLATEINFFAARGKDEYLAFVTLYKDAYHAVKRISPLTKVFVSFQYELVFLRDVAVPGQIAEHAKLIDVFRPELDLAAITSYPCGFDDPARLPDAYYSHFRKYLKPGDQVFLMEIGWPSASKAGSEQKQQRFLERLPALLKDLAPTMTAWSLLHDVNLPGFPPELASTGLLNSDGKPKTAWKSWKELAKSGSRR